VNKNNYLNITFFNFSKDPKMHANINDKSFKSTTSGLCIPSSLVEYVNLYNVKEDKYLESIFFVFRENIDSKSEINLKLNPVGSLQELCMARHCPFPVYSFPDENSNKFNARYTAVCYVSPYEFSGK